MERFLRVVLVGLLVVVAAGIVASATPGMHAKPNDPVTLVTTSSSSPEPTETETPDPTNSGSPPSGAPDFSACLGLTSLENAICRHEAKLVADPTNTGVANALAHLQANLAKKQAHDAAKASGTHGNSGNAPGHSGDPHVNSGGAPGHSGEPHGSSGSAPGHSKP